MPDGHEEEQADREQRRTTSTVPNQAPPPISSPSSSSSCAFAEMPSALKPILSDSAERDDAADERQRAAARWRFVQETSGNGLDLDLAVRGLARVGLVAVARGDLLGGRLADRDGPGRDAAHHHALEHRLAADGRVTRNRAGLRFRGRRRLAHLDDAIGAFAPGPEVAGRAYGTDSQDLFVVELGLLVDQRRWDPRWRVAASCRRDRGTTPGGSRSAPATRCAGCRRAAPSTNNSTATSVAATLPMLVTVSL